MKQQNVRQVLSNLYGLMMEINIHRGDDDILAELQAQSDPLIDAHLLKLRKFSMKLKAQENNRRFQKALEQIQLLKQKGRDEINKIFGPVEQQQLVPLFRKFEELTKDDEASIIEDQELLNLLEILKDKLDEDNE